MSGTGVQGQKVITELKVSANLMSLEAGVFCIFHTPGAAPSDPATGLPSVRLSLPPGGVPGSVEISTFRPDGWLDQHGAALVRIPHGSTQVLVTIYQDPTGRHEAPKLQVLRLLEGMQGQAAPQGTALPAAQPPAMQPAAPEPALPRPDPAAVSAAEAEIGAHVQVRGDILARVGEWVGDRSSQRWMEGFVIAPKRQIAPADIEYQAVLGRDWLSPWAEGGQFCGSRGMSLPILGLRVRLRGDAAQQFGLRVSATFTDGSALGPVGSGELCQSDSYAPLEAFQVSLARPGAAVPSPGAAVPSPGAAVPSPGAGPARAAVRPAPQAKPPAAPAPVKKPPAKGPAASRAAPPKPPARRR